MFEKEKECEDAIEGLSNSGFQASYAKIGQVKHKKKNRVFIVYKKVILGVI